MMLTVTVAGPAGVVTVGAVGVGVDEDEPPLPPQLHIAAAAATANKAPPHTEDRMRRSSKNADPMSARRPGRLGCSKRNTARRSNGFRQLHFVGLQQP